MSATILVVDDDASVTASLALLLKQAGFRHVAVADPQAAIDALRRHPIDLVIQDMNFSRSTTGEEGLGLLRDIRRVHGGTLPVVLITAWGSIALAVEGMKAGATDFITKPWDNERLIRVIRTTLRLARESGVVTADRESLDREHDFSQIIGNDPGLVRVLSQVARVAPTDATVLIAGESGTGKELLVDAIHANSARAARPLVKVNMGGIVASLFESEMFGHVRGAFTDARTDRTGYFEQARNGTIFLDEIAEVDRASQVKLLRVLQSQEVQRVGSGDTRVVNFRVVAATNRDLSRLVVEGAFREDLYYRLNLITLEIPPLRKRKGDIALIAANHLRQLTERHGLADLECSTDAYDWLTAQPWPGNVRQLKHCIERVVLLSGKTLLTRSDFEAISSGDETGPPHADWLDGEQRTLDEVEQLVIERAMTQCSGNITRAAALLGLSRSALYRRLAKHGLAAE